MKKKPLLNGPIVEAPEAPPPSTTIPGVAVPAKLSESIPTSLAWSKANQIANDAQLQVTTDHRIDMDGFIKQIDELFEGDDKPQTLAYRTWKSLCDMHNGLTKDLKAARDMDNTKIKDYVSAEKRCREEEQRDAQRKINEDFQKKQNELLAKAEKAKKPETQQKYQEEAARLSAPTVIAAEAPRVEGMKFVGKWKSKIVNEAAFWDFVFTNKRRDLVAGPATNVLDALAVQLKSELGIPGVEAFEDLIPTKAR